MSWIELHITTSAQHAPHFGDQLTLFGAEAVTFHDAGNQPIYEPSNSTPRVWDETRIIGLFSKDQPIAPILAFFENPQQAELIKHFKLEEVADEDWVRRALDSFQPMCFGKRLWVCPTWHTPPEPEAINVILDPGISFGTGTHPTTALCLEWLDQHMQPGWSVIDYGCGSGILGIAASKLGAASVSAVDHDPEALESTQRNRDQNLLCPEKFITYLPEQLNLLEPADLIIANILAKPLIDMAPKLAILTKLKGKIVLSGLLVDQISIIIEAFKPWFTLKIATFNELWVCLAGIRANNN
jgi:ribosomal protein L11 methyltransferase